MPPKKKGKKKGKKKDEGELQAEDRMRRANDELEALRDHLAKRKEIARRGQEAGVLLRDHMRAAEDLLRQQQQDQRSVGADMTRQYKTMQTEMSLRVHMLEAERDRLRAELERAHAESRQLALDKERQARERDQCVHELEERMRALRVGYEGLLHDCFAGLRERLDAGRKSFEDTSSLLQAQNKQVLLEFGLNPLDI